MRSPFEWTAATRLPAHPDGTPEAVLRRLADGLRGLKAGSVEPRGGGVEFRGGAFRWVPNWDLLVPISWGRVEARLAGEGVEVRYRLRFTELIVSATLGFADMGGLIASATPVLRSQGDVVALTAFVIGGWLATIGLSVARTMARFPRFVERTGTTLTRWPPV